MKTYVFRFCFGNTMNRKAIIEKRIKAQDYVMAFRMFGNSNSIFIIEIKEESVLTDEQRVQNISPKMSG